MRFKCHREKCRRKDRPFDKRGIIVIDPPIFGHAGNTVSGKKQLVFENDQLDRLNKLVYKWVKSGRLTEQEFVSYTRMLAEPLQQE